MSSIRTQLTARQVRQPVQLAAKLAEHDEVLDRHSPDFVANGGAVQLLSGAGAINLTTRTTLFTSTGASQALTLADGTGVVPIGFRKRVMHYVDGGSGVFTAGGALHLGTGVTTVTLTAKGDWVEFEWDGTNWNVIGCSPVSVIA
jgi:hypothetical protein